MTELVWYVLKFWCLYLSMCDVRRWVVWNFILYTQVWRWLCSTLATKFESSGLTDCMLHIPPIFTTYVRHLNWHVVVPLRP